MDDRRILPFYMTYPLPIYYQEEDTIMRDLDYIQQMYPSQAKRYQKIITSILDRMDYEGSMIYDEYPDRWQLYKLSMEITDRIKREDEKDTEQQGGNTMSAEEMKWLADMIQILLFYEIYKRRHNRQRGILKF